MKRSKVLLIEDDPDISLLLSVRLQVNGFDLITAQDGEEGLKKARTESPDVILLDLMIPKINGFDVCRMLKFDDAFKKIPIIILSALSQQKDRQKAIEAGADAVFVKPFDLTLLLTKIRSLASER